MKKRLLAAIGLLAMLVGSASAQTPVTLRLAWWGGDARHEMYNRLADMYEAQNPHIKLEREFAGFNPYFERLATQTAGGNAPDIIHMHQVFVEQYASRGALMNLESLVASGTIDLSSFSQGLIDSGKVGSSIYMITLGNSAPGTHYNRALFEQAGVTEPDYSWTWEDFERTAVTLSDALGADVYGVNDAGGWDQTLELFMRQKGKHFFEGDTLGFNREDLIEYWNIWQRLRAAGAIPPPDLEAEYVGASHPESMLARGIVAMHPMSGNQHKLFQQYSEAPLGLTTLPRSNDPAAPYGDTIGGAYLSLSARTRHPEEAARFIDWFINDSEVARIYNAEHGPPGSVLMQEAIREQLDPADQRVSEMMSFISEGYGATDVRPARAGEVVAAFGRIYEELAFGRYGSVEAAVDAFFDEADFILF